MKRTFLFVLAFSIAVLSGCGSTDTDTTKTTTPTSVETQTVTLPDALSSSESALYFEEQPSEGDPALSLQYQGERYHAVQLVSALSPIDGEVGVIRSAVNTSTLPSEELQCNCAALVGQTVYKAGDCLYTVASSSPQEGDTHIGTRYRQWVKSHGNEAFEGIEIGGEANAIRLNGTLYYALYTIQSPENDPSTVLRVVSELPTDRGFAYVGTVLACETLCPTIDFSSAIGGLGRDLYASAAYPGVLYAGDPTEGYWVLLQQKALPFGNTTLGATDGVLDLTAADESDIAYLVELVGGDTVVGMFQRPLTALGVHTVRLPNTANTPAWKQALSSYTCEVAK